MIDSVIHDSTRRRVADRPAVALILLNNSGIGGAERRFGQVVQAFQERHERMALIVNASLYRQLNEAGILKGKGPDFVMQEPFGVLAGLVGGPQNGDEAPALPDTWSRRTRSYLAFLIRKLDYLLGCVAIAWWVWTRRPRVLHLVLGGAYVALPLQFLGLAPRTVVSVVSPSLRGTVGVPWALPLYRWAIRAAPVVDALTPTIKQQLIDERIPAERIRVSPGSCVNTARFTPSRSKKPWVVFSGRLIAEKRPELFIEACALVRRQAPGARFFMLGDGPSRASVDEAVRRHGLEAAIQVGWQPHVETILGEALIFVSLQQMDNYPSQALLEAMACGLAAVATDVGLTAKLVDDTVGRRVPPTPEAVADAIVELLADPARAEAMGRAARERVVREHSMEAYLRYLRSVYDAAGGGEAACSS